jgi:hypothetical protein
MFGEDQLCVQTSGFLLLIHAGGRTFGVRFDLVFNRRFQIPEIALKTGERLLDLWGQLL